MKTMLEKILADAALAAPAKMKPRPKDSKLSDEEWSQYLEETKGPGNKVDVLWPKDLKVGDICLVMPQERLKKQKPLLWKALHGEGKPVGKLEQYLIQVIYIKNNKLASGAQDFYYVAVDESKNMIMDYGDHPHYASSSMLLSDMLKVVGHEDLEKHQYQNYVWYTTGNDWLDIEVMPNLDGRWEMFKKLAPKNIMDIYSRQEDINYKRENAEMVNDFCEFVAGGGKPALFQAMESDEKNGGAHAALAIKGSAMKPSLLKKILANEVSVEDDELEGDDGIDSGHLNDKIKIKKIMKQAEAGRSEWREIEDPWMEEDKFNVSKTYDIIDPGGEAIKDGEPEESGFEYEDVKKSAKDILDELQDDFGYFENFQKGQDSQSLYATDPVTDYKTGTETNYAIHINGEPQDMARLNEMIDKYFHGGRVGAQILADLLEAADGDKLKGVGTAKNGEYFAKLPNGQLHHIEDRELGKSVLSKPIRFMINEMDDAVDVELVTSASKKDKEAEAAENAESARPADKTAEARTWKESLDLAKEIYPDAEKILKKMGDEADQDAIMQVNLQMSDDNVANSEKIEGADLKIPHFLEEAVPSMMAGSDKGGGNQDGLAISALRALAEIYPSVKEWCDDPDHAYISYGESSGMMPYHHANYPDDAIILYLAGQDSEEEIQREVSELAKEYGKDKDLDKWKQFLKLISDEHLGVVYRYDGKSPQVELYSRVQYVYALYFKAAEVMKVVNKARKLNKEESINQDEVKQLIEDLKEGAGDYK